MRPKPLPSRGDDLSRPRLDAIIDVRHPLVQLAGLIDWARFDAAFGTRYAEIGRPGLPTRLMVGLHLLKHLKGLSDEEVCAQWVENPYMQAFCGEAVFCHVLPLDRSSLTRWRTRIGADQLEELLAETIAAATRSEALPPERLERVTIDTSVQTKAVAHPTDSPLLLRGIEWLNRLAKRQVGRLVHTRGHAQAMRYVRRMRTWLGRLERDVGRKIAGDAALEAAFATARARIARLLAQRPEDPNKIYALHAPEVECIAKGKARIRYEFGVKFSLAVTNARADGGQFVLGVRTLPGNPYDGHTLGAQIEQVERLTGCPVKRAYVDRGYRGHKLDGPTQVFISHTRGIVSPTIRRELRRRNAIEPVIGHLKSDGLVERNRLLGAHGDAINAILAAAGHNLRLLVAWLRAVCALLWAALVVRHNACRAAPTPA